MTYWFSFREIHLCSTHTHIYTSLQLHCFKQAKPMDTKETQTRIFRKRMYYFALHSQYRNAFKYEMAYAILNITCTLWSSPLFIVRIVAQFPNDARCYFRLHHSANEKELLCVFGAVWSNGPCVKLSVANRNENNIYSLAELVDNFTPNRAPFADSLIEMECACELCNGRGGWMDRKTVWHIANIDTLNVRSVDSSKRTFVLLFDSIIFDIQSPYNFYSQWPSLGVCEKLFAFEIPKSEYFWE